MSILIEKVRIKNFRSLKDVEINLSPITVLVGANNSGKTTFLKALQLAFRGDGRFVSQEDLFIGKDGKLLPKAERIITIDVKIIPFENDEFDEIWLDAINNGVEGIRNDANGNSFFAFRTQVDLTTSRGKFERFVITDWDSETINNSSNIPSRNLSVFPFYYIDAQRDLHEDLGYKKSNFGELVGKIDYDDTIEENIEKDLITLNEKAIKESDVLKHTKETLKELNQALQTQGSGVEITPFPKKVRDLHKGIKVHFQDGGSDSFSMEYHGMGTRSWASLLALKAKVSWDKKIADSKDEKAQDAFFPIVTLEEPEAHLHPNAQRQVYRQLSEIVGQKLISTHSPYIAGVADLEELRCFSKLSDITKVSQIHFLYDDKIVELQQKLATIHPSRKADIIRDIKVLEDMKRNVVRRINNEILKTRGEILFSRLVILFEGITEEQSLPLFAKEFFGLYPYELGITFINVGGKGNYRPYINLFESMSIDWLILSDSEIDTIEDLLKQIEEVKGDLSKVVLLPKEDDYEAFMLREYEEEVRRSIALFHTASSNVVEFNQAKLKEWLEKDITEIEKVMDGNDKAKLAPIYTELIIENQDFSKRIPSSIEELFIKIQEKLNCDAKWLKMKNLFNILKKLENYKNETTTL